jgi:hypothetical protein
MFPVIPTLNLNFAPVPLDKIFRDKQADAGTHGNTGREEGLENPR